MFVSGFFCPTREFFYSFGDVTIIGERLQILTDNDQRGLFNVPTALLIQSIRLIFLNPRSLSLSVKLPVFTTWGSRGWDSVTKHSTYEAPHGHLQLTYTKINRDIDIIMQWK